MSNFKRLDEVATIDISNVDKQSKENQPKVKLCNFVDVYHNWAITLDMKNELMDATANEGQIQKFTIKKGQVAITKDSETRDDIGVPTYIADNMEGTLLGYHCALITPNQNILNGKYLNAFLNSPYAKKHFENMASGSGQRYTLTQEAIASMMIPIIPIKEQHTIGNLFSTIDRRIKNNNAINAELETMAKTLYDYWFLQFEFPNEEGKPYKSSGGAMVWNEELKREIPEGWETKALANLCEIRLGGTPNTKVKEYWNGNINWLNSGEVAISPIIQSEKTITEKAKNETSTSYAEVGDVLMSITRYIRPSILGINACYNQSVIAIIANSTYKTSFIYPFLLSQVDRYMTLRTGAQQPHINKEVVENTPVVKPVISVLNSYYKEAENIYRLQINIAKQNQELASLRDFLLPLLMNGQVGFKDSAPK